MSATVFRPTPISTGIYEIPNLVEVAIADYRLRGKGGQRDLPFFPPVRRDSANAIAMACFCGRPE